MTSVVVTGAGGFIGRATVSALSRAGIDVVAVARRPFTAPGGAQTVFVDRYADFAAPAGSTLLHFAENPLIGQANTNGARHETETTETLTSLLTKGFRHVIYASSGQVYDRSGKPPFRPDSPVSASDSYSRAKLANEARVLASGGGVLRLGNIYGPGMQRQTVMMTVMSQIPGTEPLRLFETTSVRDFVWIDDTADAFAQAALKRAAGIHNVGTGIGASAGEVARLALQIAGEGERSVVADGNQGSPAIVLDPGSAERSFGWHAKTTLADGLKHMLSTSKH